MSETALHVLPGQRAYVVTRVEPQFNSRHESLDDAIRQARELAERDGATLLVHDADGSIVTRDSFDTT
jgi:Uncharacterized protein conserved in bacteria (DUF2188)